MQGGRPLLLAAAASGRAGRGMNRAPRLRVSHPVSGSRPEPGRPRARPTLVVVLDHGEFLRHAEDGVVVDPSGSRRIWRDHCHVIATLNKAVLGDQSAHMHAFPISTILWRSKCTPVSAGAYLSAPDSFSSRRASRS